MVKANFASGIIALCMFFVVYAGSSNHIGSNLDSRFNVAKQEVVLVESEKAVEQHGWLSSHQHRLLSLAYDTAKKDGLKNPEILQGILLQESQAGEHKAYKVAGHEYGLKANERYYGVTQMKLAAARDVLNTYPELREEYHFQTNTDEEIIANLIMNDEFAIAAASKYLKIISRTNKDRDVNFLIAAYNKGVGGARAVTESLTELAYVRGVKSYIARL